MSENAVVTSAYATLSAALVSDNSCFEVVGVSDAHVFTLGYRPGRIKVRLKSDEDSSGPTMIVSVNTPLAREVAERVGAKVFPDGLPVFFVFEDR